MRDDDLDLENRLRRLPTELALSPLDQAALARLREWPRVTQSRRLWRRVASIPVSLAAVLLIGAVVLAASEASVVLRYHPSPVLAPGKVYLGKPCPDPELMSVADIQHRVSFHIAVINGATPFASRYYPPCTTPGFTADAAVQLAYMYKGESISIDETKAPAGPVYVDLKGKASNNPAWKIVTLDGDSYAIFLGTDFPEGATFKRGNTRIDLAMGAKGGPNRAMSLAEFEAMLLEIN
jgi:hypothetical protein